MYCRRVDRLDYSPAVFICSVQADFDADENGNEMEGFCHNRAVGRLLVNNDLLRMVLNACSQTHTNVQFHWCVYDGEESEVMSLLSVMVSQSFCAWFIEAMCLCSLNECAHEIRVWILKTCHKNDHKRSLYDLCNIFLIFWSYMIALCEEQTQNILPFSAWVWIWIEMTTTNRMWKCYFIWNKEEVEDFTELQFKEIKTHTQKQMWCLVWVSIW